MPLYFEPTLLPLRTEPPGNGVNYIGQPADRSDRGATCDRHQFETTTQQNKVAAADRIDSRRGFFTKKLTVHDGNAPKAPSIDDLADLMPVAEEP